MHENQKSEPWFDLQCRKTKNNLKTLGGKLSKEPADQQLKMILNTEKKHFRKIIFSKIRKYKEKTIVELEAQRRNQKELRKIF